MTIKKKLIKIIIPLFVVCMTLNTTIGATLENTNKTYQLPDFTVVSDKTGISKLQNNYESIIVVDSQELNTLPDIQDLTDLLEYIPNINDSGEFGFSMRGIPSMEANSFFGTYDKSPVITIYKDGSIVQNNQLNFGTFGLWDIDSVEFFFGPSSTLYGGKSFAGGIFINTKNPTFYNTGNAELNVGKYNSYRAAAAQSGPINEAFAYRVAVDYQQTDGFNTSYTGEDDVDFSSLLMMRGKLLYAPKELEEFSTMLNIEGNIQKANLQGGNIDNSQTNAFARVTPEGIERDDGDLNGINTGLNFAWQPDEYQLFWNNSFNYFNVDAPYQAYEGTGTTKMNDEATVSELRFLTDSDNYKLLLAVYGNYSTHDSDYDFKDCYEKAIFANYDMQFIGDYKDINTAIYGEYEYKVTEPLTLVAGLRLDYEYVKQDISQTYFSAQVPFLSYLSSENSYSDDFLTLLPKVGIIFDFSETVSTALTIQRNFRSGGLSVPIGTQDVQPEAYDPEYSWNYELALRTIHLDKQLLLNANIFFMDWKDRQVRVGTGYYDLSGQEVYMTENAENAQLSGTEVSSIYYPEAFEGFNVYAGLGFSYVNIDDKDAETWNTSNFSEGSEFNATLAATYGKALGLFLNASASYHDLHKYSGLGDYTLVNLKAGWNFETFGIFAYCKNAFDEEYYLSFGEDTPTATIGDPRTFGVYASIDW
jgi:outer membrane receptor for ferrienterochelin and colicin